MTGQNIQCFIGQYGVQMASATWELLCLENGLRTDGKPIHTGAGDSSRDALFTQSLADQYSPRCVLIDTEPSVVDEVRVGCYRNLFNSKQLITSYEDSASNFARGYYLNSARLMGPTMESLRQQTEACDNLQVFTLHHSCGGGTGSGFTAALMERLQDEYAKRARFDLALFSSPSMQSTTVEPYNTLLSCYFPIETTDLTLLNDNKSLLYACTERMQIRRPKMAHLNRLLAQVVSGLLTPMHRDSELPLDVWSLQTNLVPYPHAHFVVSGLSPLGGIDAVNKWELSCIKITQDVFNPNVQLLSCSTAHDPVYLACCLMYRGNASIQHVNDAIVRLKSAGHLPWVDWCPTGFKVSISRLPMTIVPKSHIPPSPLSLLMLHNSTMLVASLDRVLRDYQALYAKRAFIHWYTSEGMDEAQFTDTFERLSQLRDEYKQFERPTSTTEFKTCEARDSHPTLTDFNSPDGNPWTPNLLGTSCHNAEVSHRTTKRCHCKKTIHNRRRHLLSRASVCKHNRSHLVDGETNSTSHEPRSHHGCWKKMCYSRTGDQNEQEKLWDFEDFEGIIMHPKDDELNDVCAQPSCQKTRANHISYVDIY